MDHRGSPRPLTATRSRHPGRPGYAVEQVIAGIEVVSAASRRLAAEVDRIIGCRAAVSLATVDRLIQRAEGLRPAAVTRARLCGLEPDLLVAGMSARWARGRARERSPGCVAVRLAGRAEAGWWTGRSA